MSFITLPGLIDLHVHLRDPGQTHKEDFFTGTSAALAGGFTMVVDMPNNSTPITTLERLKEKINIAKQKTVSDIGFYFGSLGDNFDEFKKVQPYVLGLKLYLDITTGGFIINEDSMKKIYEAWNSPRPILLHSEEDKVTMVINVIRKTGQKSHFCHVSSKHELSQIIKAKEEGLPVTCGVCPHHLFLTEDESKPSPYHRMKPYLKQKKDLNFLWEHIKYIDAIESDHAPHTKEEKDSDKPPFGVPGLETTLPLLLSAEQDKRLSMHDITRLCYDNPLKILNIQPQKNTSIKVEKGFFEIKNENLLTKCGWSPFNGWKVPARVTQVTLRGEKVFENGKVLASPGTGKIINE